MLALSGGYYAINQQLSALNFIGNIEFPVSIKQK